MLCHCHYILCENMTSYTKPEVDNISLHGKKMTEAQPCGNIYRNLVKFGSVVFELCQRTDRHILVTRFAKPYLLTEFHTTCIDAYYYILTYILHAYMYMSRRLMKPLSLISNVIRQTYNRLIADGDDDAAAACEMKLWSDVIHRGHCHSNSSVYT